MSTQTLFSYSWLIAFLTVTMPFCAIAQSTQPAKSQPAEYIERAAQNQALLSSETSPQVAVGETAFFPLKNLIRGQDEISVDNIEAKLRAKVEAKEMPWSADQNKWLFPFDVGRSLNPLVDPILVVLGPQGPVIIDGHHEFYLALSTGAQSIAAFVKADLSHLEQLQFWREMANRKFTLLAAAPSELARQIPSTDSVRDNPNRYLASLLALKVSAVVRGAGDAAWFKFDKGIPFVEFEIAEVLKQAGIVYAPSWHETVPAQVTQAARKALMRAQHAKKSIGLMSIYVPTSSAEAQQLRSDPAALQELRERFTRHDFQCRLSFEP